MFVEIVETNYQGCILMVTTRIIDTPFMLAFIINWKQYIKILKNDSDLWEEVHEIKDNSISISTTNQKFNSFGTH